MPPGGATCTSGGDSGRGLVLTTFSFSSAGLPASIMAGSWRRISFRVLRNLNVFRLWAFWRCSLDRVDEASEVPPPVPAAPAPPAVDDAISLIWRDEDGSEVSPLSRVAAAPGTAPPGGPAPGVEPPGSDVTAHGGGRLKVNLC